MLTILAVLALAPPTTDATAQAYNSEITAPGTWLRCDFVEHTSITVKPAYPNPPHGGDVRDTTIYKVIPSRKEFFVYWGRGLTLVQDSTITDDYVARNAKMPLDGGSMDWSMMIDRRTLAYSGRVYSHVVHSSSEFGNSELTTLKTSNGTCKIIDPQPVDPLPTQKF